MPTRSDMKDIRLTLARSKEFPNGSVRHGYAFTAPLDPSGHLDPELWKKNRDVCRVTRFWGGEEKDVGHLVHRGKSWGFHYDLAGDEGDEFGFKLANHVFVPGEYVSIRDDDDELHTFLVASVDPFPG